MHVSSKAIVISKIKYKDNDLIVKCYTQSFGLKSYLIKNVFKTKKGKIRPAHFQLFSLLDIEADHKENRSLQYIRDLKRYENTTTLDTNIIKTTIVLFLSEILSGILKEEEQNLELYGFLEASIRWFDTHETYPNFHLIFLIELTKYLGFYPDLSNINADYFNLEEGQFHNKNTSVYCVHGENLTVLKLLLGIKFDDTKKLKVTSKQKGELLNMILLYFKLHLDAFKTPKSLAILNQVFD